MIITRLSRDSPPGSSRFITKAWAWAWASVTSQKQTAEHNGPLFPGWFLDVGFSPCNCSLTWSYFTGLEPRICVFYKHEWSSRWFRSFDRNNYPITTIWRRKDGRSFVTSKTRYSNPVVLWVFSFLCHCLSLSLSIFALTDQVLILL